MIIRDPNELEGYVRSPERRTLQIFAFDPAAELDLEISRVNCTKIDVRWEEGLLPGPIGESIEVIDVDPASGRLYPPVDLNHPHLLATDGLSPSVGTPQFHQQMVYAVAMTTIDHFEQALGRPVRWSASLESDDGKLHSVYYPRLRIYPHALREANAYYSPDKKALLFGYFNAVNSDARDGMPGGLVFTCLSHDVIVHEVTHAVLDGLHPRLIEPTNADTLAFHEGFADIVALFQHFTLPGVLETEIARTRGDLEQENVLTDLAAEFGRAIGRGQALRRALGEKDRKTGHWARRKPDPSEIERNFEPHGRGAIFVAAVFDAFVTVYKARVADLMRIASDGSGILPQGSIHPDLVSRLSSDARKVARRVLRMAIRALDYLPPVDVTYGDYLRALVTADCDAFPKDAYHFRAAIIGAFQGWGIHPYDVRTLSVETLRWKEPSSDEQELFIQLFPPAEALRVMAFADEFAGGNGSREDEELRFARRDGGDDSDGSEGPPDRDRECRRFLERFRVMNPERHEKEARRQTASEPESARRAAFRDAETRRCNAYRREHDFASFLHRYLAGVRRDPRASELRDRIVDLLGIDLVPEVSDMRFEVHAVRPALRLRPDGRTSYDLLIILTQRRKEQITGADGESWTYRFRGGSTLLIDPLTGRLRYSIKKSIRADVRRARQEDFLRGRMRAEGPDAAPRYRLWREHEGDNRVRQETFRLMHLGTCGGCSEVGT